MQRDPSMASSGAFIGWDTNEGPRLGYEYKDGARGMGYYQDPKATQLFPNLASALAKEDAKRAARERKRKLAELEQAGAGK